MVVPLLRFCIGGDYEVISAKGGVENPGFSTPKGSKGKKSLFSEIYFELIWIFISVAVAGVNSPPTPKTPRLYFYETGDVTYYGPKSFPLHASVQNHVGEIVLNIFYGNGTTLASPAFGKTI